MTDDASPRELQVGGAVPLDTGVYVVRRSDDELLQALRKGEYCNVLCPRQMGKTSAIMRIRAELRGSGFRTALIDLAGRLGTPANADDWYVGLLSHLSSQFELGCDVKAWWVASLEPTANQKLLAFFRDEILAHHPGVRFVVFLDEIDHTLNLPYTDDFFLAIRSLYNDRAGEPDLRRLTFCLAGVFTPNELVKQQRTTTYNVGRTFELQDFDRERDDLSPLARALSPDPARGEALLDAVLKWTGGQPYLTASACKKVIAAGLDAPAAVDRLIEESFLTHEKPLEDSDGTHFENIERFLGQRVTARLATVNLYRRILRGGEERDRPTSPVLALKLSGLVKIGRDARLTIRNEIYRRRFDEQWAVAVIRVAERWTRRRLVLAMAAGLAIIAAAGFGWRATRIYSLGEEIARAEQDVPTKAYQELRQWNPAKADELMAGYWDRRASEAEQTGTRDEAILLRLKARTYRDTAERQLAVRETLEAPLPKMLLALRHEVPVLSASFSADGTKVVTASEGKTAQVWDATTGRPLGAPLRHEDTVRSASFSADGTKVVSASFDKTARLWDATTGRPLGAPLRHVASVGSASFSADGTKVVTACDDNTAQLWDGTTGRPLGAPLEHKARVLSASLSTNGAKVVTASEDKTAQVWDATTGQPLGAPLRHEDIVRSASFSADGTKVVTASHDKTAQLWDATTGLPLGNPLRHESIVLSASFSTDGTKVVTASFDWTARLWDATTGLPLSPSLRHGSLVSSASFSADGTKVVTASKDQTARLWDAATGLPLGVPLRHESQVNSANFSADGTKVVTASPDHTARLWDAATGKPLGDPLRHTGFVVSASFSVDGTKVVTASDDKTARLWDATTGKLLGAPLRHENSVNSASFSLDGTKVVTVSDHSTAGLWDVTTGRPFGASLRHEANVWSASFSADGTKVVTASADQTARLWDATTGQPVSAPLRHEDWVWNASFSADGTKVVTQTGSCIRWWETSESGSFRVVGIRWPQGIRWMPQPWISRDGRAVKAAEAVTGDSVVIRTLWLGADDPSLPILSGAPAELLAEWHRRLALKFEDDTRSPKLVPMYPLPPNSSPPKRPDPEKKP